MGELIILMGPTTLDLPPERVLQEAIKADLESVVVLGFQKDGKEYLASSQADGADCIWLMRRCEHRLMMHIDRKCSDASDDE